MRITIIGTGYVGLVSGTCFAEMGNDVICLGRHLDKLAKLRKGIPHIFESGLQDLMKRNIKEKRLDFTVDKKRAIQESDIIFIAVGTPPGKDFRADLSAVKESARDIGKYLNKYKIIATKSTVPVGTAELVKKIIKKNLKRKVKFDVVSNPEFLREGAAVKDFLNPDRVVVGVDSERAKNIFAKLYSTTTRIGRPVFFTDVKSAELIKYASNSFLATKISFINELANFCEKIGADIKEVARGMGLDSRIGARFLHAGVGYGGSCFPKDVKALIKSGEDYGYNFRLIRAAEEVNEYQRKVIMRKINELLPNLKNKIVAVWGLSFKPKTDDMREAPSITIIDYLLENKARVQAFDPIAKEEAKKIFGTRIKYTQSFYQALKNASLLVVMTEWDEFRQPDFDRMKKIMRTPNIIDGRNIYEPSEIKKLGFNYLSIGRK